MPPMSISSFAGGPRARSRRRSARLTSSSVPARRSPPFAIARQSESSSLRSTRARRVQLGPSRGFLLRLAFDLGNSDSSGRVVEQILVPEQYLLGAPLAEEHVPVRLLLVQRAARLLHDVGGILDCRR